MPNTFTDHPGQTAEPLSYRQHSAFAIRQSVRLIFAGVQGIIHGIFPWMFRVRTAEHVIKTAAMLERTGRHTDLIEKHWNTAPLTPDRGASVMGRLPRLKNDDGLRAA